MSDSDASETETEQDQDILDFDGPKNDGDFEPEDAPRFFQPKIFAERNDSNVSIGAQSEDSHEQLQSIFRFKPTVLLDQDTEV